MTLRVSEETDPARQEHQLVLVAFGAGRFCAGRFWCWSLLVLVAFGAGRFQVASR